MRKIAADFSKKNDSSEMQRACEKQIDDGTINETQRDFSHEDARDDELDYWCLDCRKKPRVKKARQKALKAHLNNNES